MGKDILGAVRIAWAYMLKVFLNILQNIIDLAFEDWSYKAFADYDTVLRVYMLTT